MSLYRRPQSFRMQVQCGGVGVLRMCGIHAEQSVLRQAWTDVDVQVRHFVEGSRADRVPE